MEKLKSGFAVTKVGLINSAALAAAFDFDGTVTITNDVNAFTVTSSGTYNTGTALAVGDYVRLGAAATTAVTLTSNVYKVTAITGTTTKTVTLDRKVTEASGSYVTGSSYNQVIPSATAVAANYGLVIESNPVKFKPGLFKFQNVTFEVTLSDAFGSTLITNLTNPSKGIGTYKEVAEIEWELRNNQREAYHVASYPVAENLNAVSSKTYDMINVAFEDKNARTVSGYDYSFHGLVIATEDESSSTVHTQLKDILNIT